MKVLYFLFALNIHGVYWLSEYEGFTSEFECEKVAIKLAKTEEYAKDRVFCVEKRFEQ